MKQPAPTLLTAPDGILITSGALEQGDLLTWSPHYRVLSGFLNPVFDRVL